jgi:hypothetical protein
MPARQIVSVGASRNLNYRPHVRQIQKRGSVRLWARSGRFPGAELKESEFGVSYWVIPEEALEGFEKEKPGPKPGTKQKGKQKDKVKA